ncbi:MAG: D-alanyl-D-alanine carboxypeptidase family protein [Oscillospiraceae bacterium]|nr:D-alanyl-D-alanine carboxypeptidase family protein [Oscillospiraceae bacterium]
MKRRIMLSIAAVMALTCFAACQGSGADGELTVNDVTDSAVSDTSIAGVTTAADQSGPREVWAGDDEEEENVSAAPSAAPARVNEVRNISLNYYLVVEGVGESFMPRVTMTPEDAANQGEIWSSSDESVAVVDEKGNIKGVGPGSCIVTVASVDSPAVMASVSVRITGSDYDGVNAVELTDYNVDLEAGETFMPYVTMYPSSAENKAEVWTSTDTSVATVNEKGVITAVNPGFCTVICTSQDNPKALAGVSVHVKGEIKTGVMGGSGNAAGTVTTVSDSTPFDSLPDDSADYITIEDDGGDMVTGISLTFNEATLEIGDTVMPYVTMYPESAEDKSELWTSSDTSVATVDGKGNITAVGEGTCTVTVQSAANSAVTANVSVTVTGGAEAAPADQSGVTTLTYVDGVLIANKTYALPSDYNPGVDPDAQSAFDDMAAAASAEGLNIYISSGFRSYDYQVKLYQRYVDTDGQAAADTYSSRPGHSEHQTGLCFDLNSIDASFGDTAEYTWLKDNAHLYGFIIRYPEGKEAITGYEFEPWHIRYLGVEKATAVYNSGLCLEEYLGIDSKYTD